MEERVVKFKILEVYYIQREEEGGVEFKYKAQSLGLWNGTGTLCSLLTLCA